MKTRLKLAFADFWGGFDPRNNYFTQLLGSRYDIELSDTPDFLIYSWFGHDHLSYDCKRIYFAGECDRPDFRICDFAFTFDHLDDPRHYRLPLYVLYFDPELLVKPPDHDPAAALAAKTEFCNFVYSNPRCRRRNDFLRKLSRYKRVDSGGRWLNNIGGPVSDKMAFIARYKFTIAFENESYPGYTTEKIVEPMRMQSLPIYWGNPQVGRDFNTASFVNAFDFPSDEALVERVIELDRDPQKYLSVMREPWFAGNRVPDSLKPDAVLAQFERIFASTGEPVARRRRSLHPLDSARTRFAAWSRFRERALLDHFFKIEARLRT